MPDKNSLRGGDTGRGLLQDFVPVSVVDVIGNGGSVNTTDGGTAVAQLGKVGAKNFSEEKNSVFRTRFLGDQRTGRVDWLQCASKKLRYGS